MACDDPAMLKKALTEAFNEIDSKHQGYIDEGELENLLVMFYKRSGKPVEQGKIKSDAEAFLRDVDKNQDGKIELNEFINYFMQFCK